MSELFHQTEHNNFFNYTFLLFCSFCSFCSCSIQQNNLTLLVSAIFFIPLFPFHSIKFEKKWNRYTQLNTARLRNESPFCTTPNWHRLLFERCERSNDAHGTRWNFTDYPPNGQNRKRGEKKLIRRVNFRSLVLTIRTLYSCPTTAQIYIPDSYTMWWRLVSVVAHLRRPLN